MGVDGWLTPRFGRCIAGIDPMLEAGRAPGPVWMGADHLDVTGIRSRRTRLAYMRRFVCACKLCRSHAVSMESCSLHQITLVYVARKCHLRDGSATSLFECNTGQS